MELENSIAIKLPEACPLHKHKLVFGSNELYFEHRPNTDDGNATASWEYEVPDGQLISSVTNGSASGGYGKVTITSDKISTFSENIVVISVNLRDPDWKYYTYTNAHGLPYWCDWDTTSLNYTVTTAYYRYDSEYTSYKEKYNESDKTYTLTFDKNETDKIIMHWTSGWDSDAYVFQNVKPKEET